MKDSKRIVSGKGAGRLLSDTVVLQKVSIIAILAVLVIFLSIVSAQFRTMGNIMNVLRQISVNGIIAVGMTFAVLTGGINIAIGGFVGLSGVVLGKMLLETSLPPLVIAGIVLLICGAVGFCIGVLISVLQVPPFIATMAAQQIIRGIAMLYSDGRPFSISDPTILAMGKGTVGIIPTPVIIFAVVAFIGWFLLNRTRFGRHVLAVGGNPVAAKASGINNNRVLMLVYSLCGALAGLGGIVLAARISSGLASSGEGYELDAIAAAVIGGTSLSGGIGSISGTILGALIIGVINNGLNLLSVSSYWQMIAKGLIIVIAVILDINLRVKEK